MNTHDVIRRGVVIRGPGEYSMPNLLFVNLGDVIVQHPVAKVNQQVAMARGLLVYPLRATRWTIMLS